MKNRIKHLLCWTLFIICGLLYLVNDVNMDLIEYEQYLLYKHVCFVGHNEESMLRMMGIPLQVHDNNIAYPEYCNPGYACASRHISNKLYIYYNVVMLYIFIDNNGVIEEVFIGGS